VSCRCKVEDGCIPRNQGRAPDPREPEHSLGVVEKAVYARVRQISRGRVEEEVTAEPSKSNWCTKSVYVSEAVRIEVLLSKRLVDAYGDVDLEDDHTNAEDMSEERQAVEPVRR
jgi:hypothetical protein